VSSLKECKKKTKRRAPKKESDTGDSHSGEGLPESNTVPSDRITDVSEKPAVFINYRNDREYKLCCSVYTHPADYKYPLPSPYIMEDGCFRIQGLSEKLMQLYHHTTNSRLSSIFTKYTKNSIALTGKQLNVRATQEHATVQPSQCTCLST
jgi:hypothetical protein